MAGLTGARRNPKALVRGTEGEPLPKPLRSAFGSAHEFRGGELEGGSDPGDRRQGWRAAASLDEADVGPVLLARFGERLLGQAEFGARGSDSVTEREP